jgi:DNA repair protein RecO (recombination protein O)
MMLWSRRSAAMKRSFRTEGIILKNNRFGEIHKGVLFLSPDQGLLDAVAYGAYSGKGKLRSITNPLCAGTLFLYFDPVKETRKITDMDCREFFEGIRGSVAKFFTASVWLETVLKTFGGDSPHIFALLQESLRLLDTAPEERISLLLVQFLWRYMELSGSAPGLEECSRCGKLRGDRDMLLYYRGAQGFLCDECAGPAAAGEGLLALSPGAVRYLEYSRNLSLRKAAEIDLDAGSLSVLKMTMLALIEDLAGSPLNSIRTGAGVL